MGYVESKAVKLAFPLHKKCQKYIGYDRKYASMTDLVNHAVLDLLERENKN